MMKILGISLVMLTGLQAQADVFLQSGESIRLSGNTIYCGVEERVPSYFCTIESSFDGSFSGEGKTELEANFNAKAACRAGSRSNGFFCEERTMTCQRSD